MSQTANGRLHENQRSPSHGCFYGFISDVELPILFFFVLIKFIVNVVVRIPNRVLFKLRVEDVASDVYQSHKVHVREA